MIDAQTPMQARQAASRYGWCAEPSRKGLGQSNHQELIALLEAVKTISQKTTSIDVTGKAEIARRIDEIAPPLAALEAYRSRAGASCTMD